MSVPGKLFDHDYDYFYSRLLTPERSAREAELIERLCELRPGQRVLDVPCGDGRIAVQFAERGYEVVGVDASERFIHRARGRGTSARFEVGDMRELAFDREFDCVVNWFSSFGYFDTATNRDVLARFHAALKPGGRLIVEQVNPTVLRRAIDLMGGAVVNLTEQGTDLMVDRVTMPAPNRSRTERFIVRDGRVRKIEFELEQLDAPELERWLRETGFRTVTIEEDRRLIAVALR